MDILRNYARWVRGNAPMNFEFFNDNAIFGTNAMEFCNKALHLHLINCAPWYRDSMSQTEYKNAVTLFRGRKTPHGDLLYPSPWQARWEKKKNQQRKKKHQPEEEDQDPQDDNDSGDFSRTFPYVRRRQYLTNMMLRTNTTVSELKLTLDKAKTVIDSLTGEHRDKNIKTKWKELYKYWQKFITNEGDDELKAWASEQVPPINLVTGEPGGRVQSNDIERLKKFDFDPAKNQYAWIAKYDETSTYTKDTKHGHPVFYGITTSQDVRMQHLNRIPSKI